MDDPDEVEGAIVDLLSAGYDREDVYVLSGEEVSERLGKGRPGLRARLFRFIHEFADEWNLIERTAEHVERGGFIVIAPADEEGRRPSQTSSPATGRTT